MRLLPSENAKCLQAALTQFKETGEIVICEQCNCGSRIRHYHGGNYHEINTLQKDSGRIFVRYETTYEDNKGYWNEISFQEAEKVITDHSDWL